MVFLQATWGVRIFEAPAADVKFNRAGAGGLVSRYLGFAWGG
jgi:hypothetical protein